MASEHPNTLTRTGRPVAVPQTALVEPVTDDLVVGRRDVQGVSDGPGTSTSMTARSAPATSWVTWAR